MANKVWESYARKFNASNKIHKGQDTNNWFVDFDYCCMCVLDESLVFQKAEDRTTGLLSALTDENQLNLSCKGYSEDLDCYVFKHIPSGLRFNVDMLDIEQFAEGKEVCLYGYIPDEE